MFSYLLLLLEEIKDEREDDRLDDEPSQRHSSEVVLANIRDIRYKTHV